MFCVKCDRDLVECVCTDFKERMESLRNAEHILVPVDEILKANEAIRKRDKDEVPS